MQLYRYYTYMHGCNSLNVDRKVNVALKSEVTRGTAVYVEQPIRAGHTCKASTDAIIYASAKWYSI